MSESHGGPVRRCSSLGDVADQARDYLQLAFTETGCRAAGHDRLDTAWHEAVSALSRLTEAANAADADSVLPSAYASIRPPWVPLSAPTAEPTPPFDPLYYARTRFKTPSERWRGATRLDPVPEEADIQPAVHAGSVSALPVDVPRGGEEPETHPVPEAPEGPGAPTGLVGPGATVVVDPMVRTIGVPRAGLPYLPVLVRRLQQSVSMLGVPVEAAAWDRLPQQLLSNYRYLVPDTEDGITGFQVSLGPGVEALITLNPYDPRPVAHPAAAFDRLPTLPSIPEEPEEQPEEEPEEEPREGPGAEPGAAAPGTRGGRQDPAEDPAEFHANETINASYRTGAHVQLHTGSTSATRGTVSLSFGVGLTSGVLDVLHLGTGASAAANASSRSTSRISDAEGGYVEDNRVDRAMMTLAYRADWLLRMRTDASTPWAGIPADRITDPGSESLLLHMPRHYLSQAPEQVVAEGAQVTNDRLPIAHYASGLTNIPVLFDEIIEVLRDQGLVVPIGSIMREELTHKLANLEAHLDESVNSARGYLFRLHDKYGGTAAQVSVHSRRKDAPVRRIGETSDLAHVENVRTQIDGTGGSHTLSHSTSLTPLSAEIDLLPVPAKDPSWGLGVSLSAGMTWATSDTDSAGRTGLWVQVPRYTGHTAGYRMELSHQATVSVRGSRSRATPAVDSQVLLRVPEPAAFKHGLPIDRSALREDIALPDPASSPGQPVKVAYVSEQQVRNTVRPPAPAEGGTVPPTWVREGKGIGMGLVEFPAQTVQDMRAWLTRELRSRGFLPGAASDELADHPWWAHAGTLDSRVENDELVDKFISHHGLESHYDQIHQDGMSFTLTLRRGLLGMDLDLDRAKVTVTGRRASTDSLQYLGESTEQHIVNLAMGMDTAGHSSSGSRTLSLSARLRTMFRQLRAGATGVDLMRSVGASQAVTGLSNRPELLEYPGTADVFEVGESLSIRVEFEHSGLQGTVRAGARNLVSPPFPTKARARLLPLGGERFTDERTPEQTPARVLDNGVVFYVDASGLRESAVRSLRSLVGPQGGADQELGTFTNTTMVRSHFKEMAHGHYTTDQFFDSGLLRDTFGAVDIKANMGRSAFAGATSDKFVLGVIKLWLLTASDTDTSAVGINWAQWDATVGSALSDGNAVEYLQNATAASRRWQYNSSRGGSRVGGKELIQLDFNRAYAFRTDVSYSVTSRQEKHSKLLWADHSGEKAVVDGRRMVYLLSEPEALRQYGEGLVPISDKQIVDAMLRWESEGDDSLKLPGDTVARLLLRWKPQGEGSDGKSPQELAARWAELLRRRHALAGVPGGGTPVLEALVRDALLRAFNLELPDPEKLFADVELPEYLHRDGGGNMLGHSGVHGLGYDSGRSTYDIVRSAVDDVAPGLLAADPNLWTGDGRRIGRVQGSLDALQALLAGGRDQAMWEDVLSSNGLELYLSHPVGWLLSDFVRITLKSVFTSDPQVREFVPNTGVENYGHGYTGFSRGASRDGVQSFTVSRLGTGGAQWGGTATTGFAEGRHRGVTVADTATTEQTAYDWGGHYRVRLRQRLTVTVERVDTAGRPLNSWLVGWYRKLASRSADAGRVTQEGYLDLQVPKGIAEIKRWKDEADPDQRPLPPLPGDAYIAGAMLDSALPAARGLLATMFGGVSEGSTTRSSLTLPALLSRSHLTNHLLEASAGRRYLLTDNLFIPGHSSDRARIWLAGDLYDPQILGEVTGSGTGRYSKYQRGTTVSRSADRWRGTGSIEADGSGSLLADPRIQPHPVSLDGGSTASRATAANESGAGTENFRREQHAKQQGPLYLVRLRGSYRLEGQRFRRHLLPGTKERPAGLIRSDEITGHVYVELFQAEYRELMARPRAAGAPPTSGTDAVVTSLLAPEPPEMGGPRPAEHGQPFAAVLEPREYSLAELLKGLPVAATTPLPAELMATVESLLGPDGSEPDTRVPVSGYQELGRLLSRAVHDSLPQGTLPGSTSITLNTEGIQDDGGVLLLTQQTANALNQPVHVHLAEGLPRIEICPENS